MHIYNIISIFLETYNFPDQIRKNRKFELTYPVCVCVCIITLNGKQIRKGNFLFPPLDYVSLTGDAQ